MRKVFFTVLIALFTVTASNAEGIAGKWNAKMDSQMGSMELIFTFNVDGEKLTGSISTGMGDMGDMQITNGKVSGNEFSFDVDMMGTAIKHKGKLDGEVIKLKVEMPEGGPGGEQGPGEMTLTKVKE
ncbi:MAG: hypothetical protein JXR61_04775 [Prolixibacteraceae bacterium]|nr:hypothetical protein [Prolixibacteraceae bacterium]